VENLTAGRCQQELRLVPAAQTWTYSSDLGAMISFSLQAFICLGICGASGRRPRQHVQETQRAKAQKSEGSRSEGESRATAVLRLRGASFRDPQCLRMTDVACATTGEVKVAGLKNDSAFFDQKVFFSY
jgi:hypothetical protein